MPRFAGMRALSPLVKICDFDSSPWRADSPGSSKRCVFVAMPQKRFVGKAAEKTNFIKLYCFYIGNNIFKENYNES